MPQTKTTTKLFKYSVKEYRAKVASLQSMIPPADNVDIVPVEVPLKNGINVPVRIYRPKTATTPFPTFIYIPGTAFVGCETQFTDAICSHIAQAANCQVLALYHRLAPEHKFPKGYFDTYSAYKAILQIPQFQLDHTHIAIGGYSSGGNYAALINIRAKKEGLPICYQGLISPLVDLSRSITKSERYKEFESLENQDTAITPEFVDWFLSLYLPTKKTPKDPKISPFWYSHTNLEGLPPTHIFTGTHDRFAGDTQAYHDRLKEAGVPTFCTWLQEENHSFLWLNKQNVFERIAIGLRESFESQPLPKEVSFKRHRFLSSSVQKNEKCIEENVELVTYSKI